MEGELEEEGSSEFSLVESKNKNGIENEIEKNKRWRSCHFNARDITWSFLGDQRRRQPIEKIQLPASRSSLSPSEN